MKMIQELLLPATRDSVWTKTGAGNPLQTAAEPLQHISLRCSGSVPKRLALTLLLLFNAAVAAAQTPANWTDQAPQTSPSPRGTPGLAYDSAHDQVVLFGGFTAGA
jgi:hypothetical protein